jgi:F0F1-type ATP synthase membrane subunit b/b'
LYWFLKAVFFQPMEATLAERRQATEGVRKAAAATLERVARKAREYEQALQAAQAEIYREQEQLRNQWREEQAARIRQMRQQAHNMVEEARQRLQAEAAEARKSLESEARKIADVIVQHILGERAA